MKRNYCLNTQKDGYMFQGVSYLNQSTSFTKFEGCNCKLGLFFANNI